MDISLIKGDRLKMIKFQDWQKESDIYALIIKEKYYFAFIRKDKELLPFTDKEIIKLFGSSLVKSYIDRNYIENIFKENGFTGNIYFCKFLDV